MSMQRRIGLVVILCCVALVATAWCGEKVKGDIKKSFNVGAGGHLNLASDIGSIEVQTHQANTVVVEVRFEARRGGSERIEKLLEDFDIDFKQSGNDVSVIAEFRRDNWNFWDSVGKHLRVRFNVTVPAKYNVDLSTSGGSITVDDLEGEVISKTSGGGLSFGNIKGPVKGKTSGGSITLDGCDGDANVRTSGGGIHIGRVLGTVEAHTSGGSIEVQEVMGAIDAETSGGSVSATITKQPQHDCRLTTSGGSVTVYLASDIKVNLDARTSGGSVRTDFPVTVKGELSKRALKAKINGGGPELYLRTSGGSIRVKEK